MDAREASVSDKFHVVCPHCAAVNRIAQERMGEEPQCGSCHAPLFSGAPVALNSENFARHVGRNDIPLLVDFWAPWCGPCKSMAPQFERAAGILEPAFRLAKLDTEAEQQPAAQYSIRSIPTLVLFKGGREIARQAGAMGAEDIARWARSKV